MPTQQELLVASHTKLLTQKNAQNQQWIDLLLRLALPEAGNYYFHYHLKDNSSWSNYYKGDATPLFVELLTALNALKDLQPKTPDTLVGSLIEKYIADTVALAHTIIIKHLKCSLGRERLSALGLLLNNVNKTTTLLKMLQTGGNSTLAVADLLNSSVTMERELTGPLYQRSALVGALIGVTFCLIACVCFAAPFFIIPLLHPLTTVTFATLLGVQGSGLGGLFGGLFAAVIGLNVLFETFGRIDPNQNVRNMALTAKKFAVNSATLFAPQSAQVEIELKEYKAQPRVA